MIVVFTDGDDNASTITAQAAIQRAKAAGVPVYTVAQGAALTNPEFLKQLSGVSQATGGVAYAIHNPGEIRGVFESVSQDLLHTYFFAFQPAPAEDREYRRIEVSIRGGKQYKVRAREAFIRNSAGWFVTAPYGRGSFGRNCVPTSRDHRERWVSGPR